MRATGIKIADWFLSQGQGDLSALDRTHARASLLVFPLYFVITLFDAACQAHTSLNAVQGEVIILQGLLALIMLSLLKLTGRFRLLVGCHLIASQFISDWSMIQSGWAFDPMLLQLPTRVIIASYVLGVRWSALVGLVLMISCFWAFRQNTHTTVMLPTGAVLFAGTLRILINGFFAVTITALFSEFYDLSLQKQSQELDLIRNRAFRMDRYERLGHMFGELNHHINNPLAILEASFYRLRMVREQGTRAQTEEAVLQPIEHSIARMKYIISELLLISGADQIEVEQLTSVRSICKNVLLMSEECCKRHHIQLQFIDHTQNMDFSCRPHQLVRILSAIVTNACEAQNHPHTSVEIAIGATPDHIEFQVTDSGPGIPKEFESKIFEPFFTTKPTHSHAGLSLSISQSLLEHQGGSLRYEAHAKGASFRVALPLKQSPQGDEGS